MNTPETAAQLVDKLNTAATEAAATRVWLASFAMEVLTDALDARIETKVARKTRTLVFCEAEAWSADGARVATATSVHRILEAT